MNLSNPWLHVALAVCVAFWVFIIWAMLRLAGRL
jgi:hypothetical protein